LSIVLEYVSPNDLMTIIHVEEEEEEGKEIIVDF
jgi:hypothetical protein